jgi:hypothetical protein
MEHDIQISLPIFPKIEKEQSKKIRGFKSLSFKFNRSLFFDINSVSLKIEQLKNQDTA